MGIEPNKPGPNNAYMIYAPIIVFTAICPSLVGMRYWSRLRKGGKLGADDIIIALSLLAALASSGVMIAACKYGFGQHIKLLTPTNKVGALKYFYICQITYKTSINLTKCSILLLYVRIFGNIRWFRYLASILILAVAMYAIASVTATIFQCNPVARAFNKAIPGACIDNEKFWYANAGFSIATDVIILFMPMPLVRQLQIPRIQKAALVLVFALGGFVVITSCLRMTTINIAAVSPDSTYDIASTMWTVIEMNIAICCASLPMIRPLVVRLFPRLVPRSSSRSRSRGYTGTGQRHGSKGYNLSNSYGEPEPQEWARVEGKDGITLTTIRKGDQCSDGCILQEGKTHRSSASVAGNQIEAEASLNIPRGPIRIQKTVQYSVEYSHEDRHKHTFA